MIYLIPTVLATSFFYSYINKAKNQKVSIGKARDISNHLVDFLNDNLEERYHNNEISYNEFYRYHDCLERSHDELIVLARLFSGRFKQEHKEEAFQYEIDTLARKYVYFVLKNLKKSGAIQKKFSDLLLNELVNAYASYKKSLVKGDLYIA